MKISMKFLFCLKVKQNFSKESVQFSESVGIKETDLKTNYTPV